MFDCHEKKDEILKYFPVVANLRFFKGFNFLELYLISSWAVHTYTRLLQKYPAVDLSPFICLNPKSGKSSSNIPRQINIIPICTPGKSGQQRGKMYSSHSQKKELQ